MGVRGLLAVMVLLAFLPAAEASATTTKVQVLAGPQDGAVIVDSRLEGDAAAKLRKSVDERGNRDGSVDASDVSSYEASHHEARTDGGCFEDFRFLQIDGRAPSRLNESWVTLGGAGGPVDSSSPLTVTYRVNYVFPTATRADPVVYVSFADYSFGKIQAACPSQWLVSFCADAATGTCTPQEDTAPTARLLVHPLSAARFDRSTIQPAALAGDWDGLGLRADTSDAQSRMRQGPASVRLAAAQGGALADPDSAAPRSSNALWPAVAALGVVALVGAAFTEAGRFWLLSRVVAVFGFSRIEREEALVHGARDELYTAIRGAPGMSLMDLRRLTGLAHGTAIHHLRVLEVQGFIQRKPEGLRTRFYPRGPLVAPNAYITHVQESILEAVRERPGATQSELTTRLGMSRQALGYHLRTMNQRGQLVAQRDGRWRRYFRPVPTASVGA